jgi:hypothetical protein
VTIGKYNVVFFPLKIISPGSLPRNGILSQNMSAIPTIRKKAPTIIKIFPIDWNSFMLQTVQYSIRNIKE